MVNEKAFCLEFKKKMDKMRNLMPIKYGQFGIQEEGAGIISRQVILFSFLHNKLVFQGT